MSQAYLTAITCSGAFLLAGLLTGVWKYLCIRASDEAVAPHYVDIAHRAALMYSFATLVIAEFTKLTGFSDGLNVFLVSVQVFFFGSAILLYVVHGILNDTDNQLRVPHVMGRMTIPPLAMTGLLGLLIIGEVGGFGTMFVGFIMHNF